MVVCALNSLLTAHKFPRSNFSIFFCAFIHALFSNAITFPSSVLIIKIVGNLNLVLVWIALKLRCVYECCVLFFFFFFFFCFHAFLEECGYCSMNSSCKCWLFSVNSVSVHCSWTHKFHFLSIFSLKMGPTALFTHLKIILLQWFQQ